MVCVNNRVHYGPMVVFVCLHITLLHYHHYADISVGIELIKCLSDAFCRVWVCKIESILSIIFQAIYGAVCIRLTHFSYDDWKNTCTLSYVIIKSEILPICHMVTSWNNGNHCMSFYLLMVQIMACYLYGANPSSGPILGYCKWDAKWDANWKHISVKFWWYHNNFHQRNWIWKCLKNCIHFALTSVF